MAVESNGRAVEPGQKGMNGLAKAPRSKPVPKSKKSFSLFSILSRAFTWYSIIVILLRCPSTADLLTDSSPRVCKPYFQVRSIIAPHLEPYYNTYAAPYVDASRPYYDVLDKRVISPATALGKKYGAPRVAQAQAFGQAQWDKNVQPQVQKYQTVLKEKYDQTLGPHVDTAVAAAGPYYEIAKTSAQQTYYEHILPTYTAVQPYALQGYGLANDFAINTALPYSKWAWTAGVVFLDRTVWPQIRILYGENVEPQLVRIGERLGRYRDGKKLKAVVEDIDSSSSASVASQTLSSIAASVSSAHATPTPEAASTETAVQSSEAPEATPESEKEIREKAQKIVGHDLKEWQEKFAKAADEGSADLEERITEITDRMVQSQAEEVGKAHIIQLEETVNSSLKKLKTAIISIVSDSKATEESEDALSTAVRKAGIAIKEKAQAVRSWRQNYDRETNELVSLSAQDTFEILDHIRDLGLQEIGMRWAWTDGITHKDWAKYHQLKTKFDEWRVDVENVVTGHPGLDKARAASEEVESQAMAIAEDAAKELTRLKETGRWKIQAADSSDDFSTKIMPAPAAVVIQKVADKASELNEAVAPSSQSQGTVESVISVGSASASSLADQASSSIIGTQQGTVESIASVAKASASSVVDQASSTIIGTQQGSVESAASVAKASASSIIDQASSSVIGAQQGSVESIASVAKASASSVLDQASSSIVGTPQGSMESVASVASQAASSLSAKASSSIVGKEPGILEQASESIISAGSVISESTSVLSDAASSSISSGSSELSKAASKASSSLSSATSSIASSLSKSASDTSSSVSSAASSASSTASKKVWGGAMAQHVEARKIIFDDIVDDSDDGSYSEKIQSMASEAGDRYADMTNAVSEALLRATSTENSPMTKLAAEKYSSALSAASVALYGTEQGAGESISSVVASKYDEAVAAASSIIYGTPTPAYQSILSSISSVAQAKLSDGLNRASAQYKDGKDYVAAINTGAPAKQKLLGQMQEQYYAGVGMAHARYSDFLDSASSAVMPTKTPVYESLYSGASAKIAGTPTHRFQAALNTASAHYSEAVGAASSKFDQLLASISSLGSENAEHVPTVTLVSAASAQYSSAMSQASKSFASINSVISEKLELGSSAVSSAVYGTETPWTESVASAASENWEALITKASEQVYGAPTPYFVTRKLLSEVKEYAAQATDEAISQYAAVQSLIGELVAGKEPDFTESVYGRLSSAYYTGAGQAASSASSYASEVYASASSVVSSVFTPPPSLEAILDSASLRVNEAVEAASIQFYGNQKGTYEEATSAAASAYSSAQSVASEKIYGTTTGYVEAAQSSISDAALSAQKAISEAIYGTETGTYEKATAAMAEAYASATAKASEAIYGPEKGAIESAQSRLTAAVESARVKLAEYASYAGEGASDAIHQASEGVEDFASSVSSAISSATSHDEL
ncbi:hypothetical protein DL95DRAFT_384089 [Leptodontidium sp. 2 PMI_412]|nr:hypothetical protein DL95DRAFT_384089 [Leptodontidium sp. 2 PMI_412]